MTAAASNGKEPVRKVASSLRSSFCFCIAWLGISILLGVLGIFVTLATGSTGNGIVQKGLVTGRVGNATLSTPTNGSRVTDDTTTAISSNSSSQSDQFIPSLSSQPIDTDATNNTEDSTISSSNSVPVDDPLSSPSQQVSNYDNNDNDDIPIVWRDNLQYRRICTKVSRATLCLTIRYPFEVPMQDPTVTYPKPVDQRFYNLTGMVFVDGNVLKQATMCQRPLLPLNSQNNSENTVADQIYACLEQVAETHNLNNLTVVAAFTRQKSNDVEVFYGTHLSEQRQRMEDYFRGYVIWVLGASPAPTVAAGLTGLFSNCRSIRGFGFKCAIQSKRKDLVRDSERRKWRRRHLQEVSRPAKLDNIWIQVVYYFPKGHWVNHYANWTVPLIDALMENNNLATNLLYPNGTARVTSQDQLRPLSVLVEFPMAHSQTETMILNNVGQVHYNMMEFTHKIMNLTTSRPAQKQLANLGLKLANIIAFDGLPQHFPSKTGGWFRRMGRPDTVKRMVGTTCMGPLPSNSPLRQVNMWERQAFQHYGLDMETFYAKTWEFSNQFWWEEAMIDRYRQLDCTHSKGGGGMTTVHKYFLQAIVDGYYESNNKGVGNSVA